LREGDIQCTVDLSNLGEGEYDIQVEKQGIPGSIRIDSSSPDKVKVTIAKKPPAEPTDTNTNTNTDNDNNNNNNNSGTTTTTNSQ
jgi:hypothetical protein